MTVGRKIGQALRGALAAAFLLAAVTAPSLAFAVPEVVSVRVTDVTTSSFSLVWMTDIYGEPEMEVYTDISMTNEITETLAISPMPVSSTEVKEAASAKRIMNIRVSGLRSSSTYYARAVMRDPEDPFNVGYSPLLEVATAGKVMPYGHAGEGVYGFSNDLAQFRVYLPPAGNTMGLGDLIIIESDGSRYPVSVFVGDGIEAPWGVLDLNNLFSDNGTSLDLTGRERLTVTVFRGGMFSTLTHYRRTPLDEEMVYVVEPLQGFFADINLDGDVDNLDFGMFREHYRMVPEDEFYNPDYNFVEDETGVVDAREFSRFSREYGRTGVE
jgi:hypothetical protein